MSAEVRLGQDDNRTSQHIPRANVPPLSFCTDKTVLAVYPVFPKNLFCRAWNPLLYSTSATEQMP